MHIYCYIIYPLLLFLKKYLKNYRYSGFAGLCILLLYACSTQQNTAVNRRLQNLSARYNYIYNANTLLQEYQDNLSQNQKDDYSRLLPLYIAPDAGSMVNDHKELDDISQKARALINEKNLSNYLDEAYMLLGKTDFYKGNYYNAAEYFSYVERAFRRHKRVYLDALTWKARTYMQLNNEKMATRLLDSAKVMLDSVKRHKAETYATLAQLSLNGGDYKNAISYLKKAIKKPESRQNLIRWTYCLAQLHEQEGDHEAALKHYHRVEHSNAPFELYFNALLSKIRVNDQLRPNTFNRTDELLKLVKDDKNTDYTDQIYYEVAEDYYAAGDYTKAAHYFKRSAAESTVNPIQKGLAYLKLADLHFKENNEYVTAKLYYDSALVTLPESYPNYEQLSKKAQNLTYLSDRFRIIHTQDTLQSLAAMTEQERLALITQRFTPKTEAPAPERQPNVNTNRNTPLSSSKNNTFYFSNVTAVSRGFTDFKKRWGNRILENNWRQSVKSSNALSLQQPGEGRSAAETGTDASPKENIEDQIRMYTALLPLTPEQLNRSNRLISDAMFEIAVFYQQVLEDQPEAIKMYEALLKRFPENAHLETVYYSLYLGYKNIDPEKSARYKDLVLVRYPASAYAKTILDPAYSSRKNALETEINKQYNATFELYAQKAYEKVIEKVNEINQRFPGNSLQIQSDYLKAIAIGKTSNVDSLLMAFQQIIRQYPADSLITPLIKDHLAYINANLNTFRSRKIALLDFDETEPRFVAQQPTQPVNVAAANTAPAVKMPPPAISAMPVTTPVTTTPQAQPPAPAASTPKTDGLFSTAASEVYYYVISVATMETSLSSSRFGIGQFNRGNYAGSNLKHNLIDLDYDQVIYVGNFSNLNEVHTYADEIKPQLTKIMKVPANLYQSFYISRENFDKIRDRVTLNRYLAFFKAHYE